MQKDPLDDAAFGRYALLLVFQVGLILDVEIIPEHVRMTRRAEGMGAFIAAHDAVVGAVAGAKVVAELRQVITQGVGIDGAQSA